MPQRPFTQDKTSLRLSTVLGADAFILQSVDGEEYLSRPFLFHLSMTSKQPDPDLTPLIGSAASVTLTDGDGNERQINGIITRATGARTSCAAELRPWLWLLTLSRDSRIFQNKAVPDIVGAIFSDHGFTDFRRSLIASYEPRTYCVQYQESAFDFVSRLLEDSGISYFFEHKDGVHTLVLADDESAYTACPHAATVPYVPIDPSKDWLEGTRIDAIAAEHSVVPRAYAADDVNFEMPSTDLMARAGTGTPRIYEYPGRFESKDSGEASARLRLEELEAAKTIMTGSSTVRFFASGYGFSLTDHPSESINGGYILRTVHHSAAAGEYRNRFAAHPKGQPFRPSRATRRPRIVGAQTATVVGGAGEEVWTDRYGRIKVQFPWDQEGRNDENSSCWVRVAQSWAGKSWGALLLPRIGQEVVVSFLDGDPDCPLVTGCIYNGDNPPPYDLPEAKTRTTWKSNSSTGGGGFNEIRFEDKAGSEELWLHAQRDMTTEVGNHRSATILEGNDTLTVSKGDRTTTIETGNESHSVAGTREVKVTGAETHANDADFSHHVAGNYMLTVDGSITIRASGAIMIDAGGSLTLKAGTNLTATGGTSLTATAGTALTLTGGTTMEISGNAAGTVDGGGILTVKGGLVKIN